MKELKLSLEGAPLTVLLGDKVTKEDLYGEVRSVVEKGGRPLERGYLLPDGTLVRKGQMSSASIDGEGTPVESAQSFVDDLVLELQPSSFEKETPLRSVPLSRLVGFNTTDVYTLEAASLAPGLYETNFNFRKSFQPRDALLLVKTGEAWLLVGQSKRTSFVGKTLSYEFFDAMADDTADDADPLDFSMM
jgi:hypothetical protein